jgi:hypothetical protein
VCGVSNVSEKTGEQKKERETDEYDTEPHGLHANGDHKKQKCGDGHSWIEGRESGNQSRDRSRGSNEGRTGTEYELQRATCHATKEVQQNKASSSHNPLEDISGKPQSHHVYSKVKDAFMEKLVGDELPKHTPPYPCPTQPEDIINERLLPQR